MSASAVHFSAMEDVSEQQPAVLFGVEALDEVPVDVASGGKGPTDSGLPLLAENGGIRVSGGCSWPFGGVARSWLSTEAACFRIDGWMCEFQRFFTALSERPGSNLAISTHLFPSCACARRMMLSSCAVKGSASAHQYILSKPCIGKAGRAGSQCHRAVKPRLRSLYQPSRMPGRT